jgi:N-acetylglucosamine kinase-like BadF-type ATPase
MKLIADSGATKSDWILADNTGERMSFQLPGMSPFYVNSRQIAEMLKNDLIPFVETKKIRKIFFYGTGCSSFDKSIIIEDGLSGIFGKAEIKVDSDILGAARALFGDKPGIACILGTGSNSCYYDGDKIVENAPSLGYFFGDEGSGAYMGRQFLKDYLLGNLPGELNNAFKKEYNYTRDNILDAVYNMPFPNRFLASFCDFYADNLSNRYIFELVGNSFREFFFNYVEYFKDYENYKQLPVSFAGSVAFFFEPLLRQIGNEFEVKIEKVMRSPINGLAQFHKKH